MAPAPTQSLSSDELEALRSAFSLFDDNGDGEITQAELGSVMSSLGLKPSPTELQDLMNEIDSDHSGTISFDEFASIMAAKVKQSDSDAELRAAFDVFDKDGNGTISADELRELMRSIGEEDLSEKDIEDMIREADANGDGNIDYNEFVQLMQ